MKSSNNEDDVKSCISSCCCDKFSLSKKRLKANFIKDFLKTRRNYKLVVFIFRRVILNYYFFHVFHSLDYCSFKWLCRWFRYRFFVFALAKSRRICQSESLITIERAISTRAKSSSIVSIRKRSIRYINYKKFFSSLFFFDCWHHFFFFDLKRNTTTSLTWPITT